MMIIPHGAEYRQHWENIKPDQVGGARPLNLGNKGGLSEESQGAREESQGQPALHVVLTSWVSQSSVLLPCLPHLPPSVLFISRFLYPDTICVPSIKMEFVVCNIYQLIFFHIVLFYRNV